MKAGRTRLQLRLRSAGVEQLGAPRYPPGTEAPSIALFCRHRPLREDLPSPENAGDRTDEIIFFLLHFGASVGLEQGGCDGPMRKSRSLRWGCPGCPSNSVSVGASHVSSRSSSERPPHFSAGAPDHQTARSFLQIPGLPLYQLPVARAPVVWFHRQVSASSSLPPTLAAPMVPDGSWADCP